MTRARDLAKGTFSGDLTVDTNTLVVDSANNRVGVGTASPASFNGGANNLVVGSGSGSEGITIYADNASNSAIFFADGTSGAETYTGQINYQHASNAMTFHTNNGTEQLRILSTGGITFNGDTAAANALDDYEEGTWTAGLYDASTGGNASSSTDTGYYTKVGRLVTASCTFTNLSTAGMTGANGLYISLPFSNFAGTILGSVRVYANVNDSTISLASQLTSTLARATIVQSRDAGGLQTLTVEMLVSGSSDLSVTITYPSA